MAKILLDYVFPITVVPTIPQASTGFLKQLCAVAKPKAGQEGNVGQVFECTNMTQVNVRVGTQAAAEIQQLFTAGMSKVYILLSNDLDLAEAMEAHLNEFFTLLATSDFDDEDVEVGEAVPAVPAVKASRKIQDILYTAKAAGVAGNGISVTYVDDVEAGPVTVGVVGSAITVHIEEGVHTAEDIAEAVAGDNDADALVDVLVDEGDEDDLQEAQGSTSLQNGADLVPAVPGEGKDLGLFKGVFGFSSSDTEVLSGLAAIENHCAFFRKDANGAKNMFYAFGSLLANPVNWLNQQYIQMPFDDEVDELGEANTLFDDKISFVIHDDEFSNRLALLACGGKAIVAPYILKNLCIDMQSRAVQWIAANQPQYTIKEASLLETRIQEDVLNQYINVKKWISAGVIAITLQQQNFVATGEIDVAEPKALWRVFNEMRQTL